MRTTALLGILVAGPLTGCASAAPFSILTPGLQTMEQEVEYFHGPSAAAQAALRNTPLRARIDNTIAVYEEELGRAQAAQGGLLNGTLNILGLLLPISGTASALALSDPDDVQTVAVAAGAATTAILALNLLLKPGAKASAARECEAYLQSALSVFERQWGPDRSSVEGTDAEWNTYLTMRATLDGGREGACGR